MNWKIILLIVLGIIVLFLVVGFIASSSLKQIKITSKIEINTTPEEAYKAISDLSVYPKWSPFLEQDPAQKYETKGQLGQIGSQFHWNGKKGKDLGFQEVISLKPNEQVVVKCDIQQPFQAKPTFEYNVNKIADNQVQIVQNFELNSGAVDAFFMWLFGVKAEMTKTNQRGLELLKKHLESN